TILLLSANGGEGLVCKIYGCRQWFSARAFRFDESLVQLRGGGCELHLVFWLLMDPCFCSSLLYGGDLRCGGSSKNCSAATWELNEQGLFRWSFNCVEAHFGFPLPHTEAISLRIASCRVSGMSSCSTILSSSKSSSWRCSLTSTGSPGAGFRLRGVPRAV